MKLRLGSFLLILIIIVITAYGMLEKRTYTNIAQDMSYLDEIFVAQLPENLCLNEANNMLKSLPSAPIILRVSVLDEVEHIGGTSRQLVKIEEVYKGADVKTAQNIYITCRRWSLSLFSEPYSIERGFVNIMETGEDYLIFIENQVDGLGEQIPVYQVFVENALAPIFSYQEHVNQISAVGSESTYVRYHEVSENEFFAVSQKGMDALIALKNEMTTLFR